MASTVSWSHQPAWRRWVYAAKPASWPKLLVPALLGQALGIAATGRLDGVALAVGAGFTVFDLLYIVFLNDWGDRQVDAIKRRRFPDGCAPKTIPDGILSAPAMLGAGMGCGIVALLLAVLGEAIIPRPGLFVAALGCLLLFVAYTLPPLRLNYRGGGELVEMTGVGVALPALHAYLQAGTPGLGALAAVLPGFALLSLASAVASGLSDEESDREGGKRTVTTTLGNRSARGAGEVAAMLGVTAWMVAGLAGIRWPLAAGALVAAYHLRDVQRLSDAAVTNAFRAQARYKHHLHLAIWRGGLVVAAASVLERLAAYGAS